jgi:DNA gyrase/topoisomerase IV subunit B
MHWMIDDPNLANQIARQLIDERVRDAEARRTARKIRRAARAQSSMERPRRTWRIRVIRRVLAR